MKYLFANWKMYLSHGESFSLAEKYASLAFDPQQIELSVFPSMLSLMSVQYALKDAVIKLGAQNAAWVEKGAYTGAVSAHMLAEVGIPYVLVGHSERRVVFHETNEAVHNKMLSALAAGMTPVLCIGESKEAHEQGIRNEVLVEQLATALQGVDTDLRFMIAYEPMWAIGTGIPCDPQEVFEAISFIKSYISSEYFSDVAVLYGGSVDADNVLSYTTVGGADGVLVGSVSTKFVDFQALLAHMTQEL